MSESIIFITQHYPSLVIAVLVGTVIGMRIGTGRAVDRLRRDLRDELFKWKAEKGND